MARRLSVAVVSPERIAAKMAGPAIRATELARALSRDNNHVTLLAPDEVTAPDGLRGQVLPTDRRGQVEALQRFEVVIAQTLPVAVITELTKLPKRPRLVFDLYNPSPIESLEYLAGRPDANCEHRHLLIHIGAQLAAADFLICASEKQRDFWFGMLSAYGLVTPEFYQADPTGRKLIDVVPFGTPERSPGKRKPVLKGIWPGIGPKDRVVLWGGGIWDWFDPITAIRGVALAAERRPGLKLFFMGLGRPPISGETEPPELMDAAQRAVKYAKRFGLEDRVVFFNKGWVPYDERAAYLADADYGISTHLDHLETRFSFRTRILDYLWAELPVITTEGDSLAELVERKGLGASVPYGSPVELANALVALDQSAARRAAQRRIAEIKPSLRWSAVTKPLRQYCKDVASASRPPRKISADVLVEQSGKLRALRMERLKDQGAGAVAKKVISKAWPGSRQ